MAITDWKSLRLFLLAVTFGSVILAIGKIVFYPATGNRPLKAYRFPESVPLADWQMVESLPLPKSNSSDIVAGQQYQYQKNNLPLQIEMRYVVDTIGDVQGLMKGHSVLKTSPGKLTVKNIEGVGFHGVLLLNNRAYLGSCINPRGGATVTSEQFRYNRNTYDITFTRVVPWLLGQESLQDRRCLWTQMSVPLNNMTPEQANKVLESAWVSWYPWWQSNFP